MDDSMSSRSHAPGDAKQPSSPSFASAGPSSRKKHCRHNTGCSICRARKVKCDERPGGCSNCERLQLKCPGSNSDRLPPVEELKLPPTAGIKRKKTYRSCNECRSSKTRCSGDRPRCQRCIRKSIECVYDADPDPAWTKNIRNSLTSDQSVVKSEQEQPEVEPSTNIASVPITRVYPPDMSASNDHLTSLGWLYEVDLPDKNKVRFLLDQYFENIHPLRCFGFLHRPSFMQKFEERLPSSPTGNALLYTVCALGAKFVLLPFISKMPPQDILSAGDKWAREASKLITADLDTISVENLMAAVLLHDHELRIGRFASAFMLSGISARMAQALQVNLEYSADIFCTDPGNGPSPVLREARRRLMWACYTMDASVGSGVEQLTLINNSDIKIQLPVSERLFQEQIPAITETLEAGQALRYAPTETMNSNPAEHMGMAAYYVRLTKYRKQVLTYVKHLDTAHAPWLQHSEFSILDNCLHHWFKNLPTNLQFTPEIQYQRHQTSQLGALVLLHVTYHQTNVDLYRIGTPRLFKIRENIHFPPERLGFLTSIRQTCFYHARQNARALQVAARYGVKVLADTWLAIVAHDTNRVMLYYLTNFVDCNSPSNQGLVEETLALIGSNLQVMKMMVPLFSVASSLFEASANLVQQSGVGGQMIDVLSADAGDQGGADGTNPERPTAPNTPLQSTPEWVLNPLAIYRLARKSVSENEKHQPELHPSPNIGATSDDNTAKQAHHSWYSGHAVDSTQKFAIPGSAHHLQQQQQRATGSHLSAVPSYLVPPPPGQHSQHLSTSGFTPTNAPPQPQHPTSTTQQNIPQQQQQQQMLRPKINVTEDMFFASNLDTIWQPAETILESTGMAPWQSDVGGTGGPKLGFNTGEIDMFMPADGSWLLPQN